MSPPQLASAIVEEIGGDVYWFQAGWGNCYAIRRSTGLTLIDTGSPKRIANVARAIGQAFGPRERIRHIAITHCHADHIGNLADIAALTGAIVYAHQLDAEGVRSGSGCLKSPVVRALARVVGLHQVAGTDVTRSLTGGETLDEAAGVLAIHTPGHTAGHTAFLLPVERILFAGDAAGERDGQLRPRPGFLNADQSQAMRTFRELVRTRGDYRTICFGHGKPISTA